MAIPSRFDLIQQVTGITDDEILIWAREIEDQRDETLRESISQELIEEVKALPGIVGFLKQNQKVQAIQLLRRSGLTDMSIRHNKIIIEAVQKSL